MFIKKPHEEYYAIINNGIEIKEGEYKEYYPSDNYENRRLKILCKYSNNKLHGLYILFNYDKTINKSSYYNNGILDGEEIQYYEHFGKRPIRKSYYINGNLHGKSKLYDGDGKLEWTIVYDNGRIKKPYKKHRQCNII
jgi:antitoxin component YwqK of YwqJK toxin-antitoxin module